MKGYKVNDMKNFNEITRGYETRHMLLRHFAALCVCFFLQMMFFMDLFGYSAIRIITCIVFVGIYFSMMYMAAQSYAKKAAKTYTKTTQNVKWAFAYAGIICGINIISLILFKFNWNFFSDGTTMTNLYAVVYNLVFYFLQSPYLSILYMQVSGNVPVVTIILMLAIPFASCVLGYAAGMKNFSVTETLRKGMFEKNDKK